MSNTGKSYDDRYFDQWYRQTKLSSPARLRRKAALAVSQAEYYLERPIRSVLDIGYGEEPGANDYSGYADIYII